jgi:hypothetical protein
MTVEMKWNARDWILIQLASDLKGLIATSNPWFQKKDFFVKVKLSGRPIQRQREVLRQKVKKLENKTNMKR